MKEDTEGYKNTSHCPVHGKYYSGAATRMTRDGKEIRGSVLCPTCYDPLQSSPADKAFSDVSKKYFALMSVCMRVSGATAEADALCEFAAKDTPDQLALVLAEVQREYAEVLAKVRRLTPSHTKEPQTEPLPASHEGR